jgi:hypothetical protein
MNKLCGVASCWVYEYTGILLGAQPILHISCIRVNRPSLTQVIAESVERAGGISYEF